MSSRVLAVTMKILIHVFLTAWVLTAAAHHNPVVYDGKRTVTITGVVTAARFAFPHSRYSIDVTAEDGTVERWLLSAEDPKDATKLGFADALKGIKVGDLLSVVGWPHKTRSRELRAHQLHYPNGDVVTMRPGNYLWTKALRRIWRLRDGQEPFATNFGQISSDVTLVKRVIHWINENDAVPRVAAQLAKQVAERISRFSQLRRQVARRARVLLNQPPQSRFNGHNVILRCNRSNSSLSSGNRIAQTLNDRLVFS